MQVPSAVQEKEKPRAKVSTSGRTEGPHVPSFNAEDREYIRTHLLSEKPIARFDTHGTVGHVLSDIDRYVPLIFGPEGEKSLTTLHRVLRHYSVNEKWTYVVVSLSTGLARQELEGLLSRKLGHSGPIIIDPDASTEDHQTFKDETEARIHKERLIKASEESGKILFVLYAIDNPDGQKERDVSMGSLQSIATALGFMLEEDARFRSLWSLDPLNADMRKRLEKIGLKSGEKEDPHAAGLHVMHALFIDMRGIDHTNDLPIFLSIMRFGIIPSRWQQLGIVDRRSEMAEEVEQRALKKAMEYRAKLASGWKPPEERLREAAAHTDHERQEQTVRAEEVRRRDPSARHSAEYAAEFREHEEREASRDHEDSAEFARNRSRQLYREARDDKLHDEHMAEDARLASAEAAAPAHEKHLYSQRRAEANTAFAVSQEQEEAIEVRERRNATNEARTRLEDGTAEGPYAGLAETTAELREDALDTRQRSDFALSAYREGERDAADRADERAQQDYAELREATPPQSEAAVAREDAREEVRVQQETRNETSNDVPEGASRPQEEQASPMDSQAARDAPGTQTQADRVEQYERRQPDEAANPALTEDRRVLVEASHETPQGDLDPLWPQNESRRQEMAAQAEQREDEKQQQIREQVTAAAEPQRPSEDEQRIQASAQLEREQRDMVHRDREVVEEIETRARNEREARDETQDRAEDRIKDVREGVDRATEPLREDDRPSELEREEQRLAGLAEGEQEMNARARQERREERRADVEMAAALMEATTPSSEPLVPEAVVENPERVVDTARNREIDRKERRIASAEAQATPAAEPESPLPKPAPTG
jgi:hypothetical protein